MRRAFCVMVFFLAVPRGWSQVKPATDGDGAMLPARAVCRLGSNRLLHADFIVATAFSPDGRKFASASCDQQGMLWEWPTGKLLHKVPGGELRFSPDSQFLAVWQKTELTIVDVGTGETVLQESAKSLPVFSRKKRLIAWPVQSTKIAVREVSPASTASFREAQHAIKALAFDGAGDLLLAETDNKRIHVRNLDQRKELHRIELGDQQVAWAEFTLDARRLAFFTKDQELTVFDLATGKPAFQRSHIPEKFEPRAVRDDGKLLLLAEHSATQGMLWSIADAKSVALLSGGRAGIGAFAPQGDLLATGGINSPHAPLFWHTRTGERADLFPGHHSPVISVAVSPDGKEAATCTFIRGDPFVYVWDTATGKPPRKLEAFADGASCVAFTPDGKQIVASGFWDKTKDAGVWDARSLKSVRTVKGHMHGAQLLAISDDGKKLATVGGGTRPDDVIIWDLQTGRVLAKHPTLGESTHCVAFLPGGRTLALGDSRKIHFWDWETGRERALNQSVFRLALSPDGWLVAVVDRVGVRLIEILTGAEVWSHPQPVTPTSTAGVATIAPDGRTVVVAWGTGVVNCFDWSTEDGALLFRGGGPGVFSRDGRRVAAIDGATALIWRMDDVMDRPRPKAAKADAKDLDTWCQLLTQGIVRPPIKPCGSSLRREMFR